MLTNIGTVSSYPFSNVAGFPDVVVVFPANPGSVYLTSNSTNIGGSTAIYGSRGANGVVLITTKRGSTGEATVDYNGYIGISMLRKKLDLLEKDDYIAMVNEVSQNDGNGIVITPDQAALLPNNDWQDLVYQTALTHSHQVSVSGGTDKTKLYSSKLYESRRYYKRF